MREIYSEEYILSNSDEKFGDAEFRPTTFINIACVISFSGVITLLLLVCFTNYSRHISARGTIVPETGLTSIISPSAGTITMVNVQDGDSLKSNNVILKLDVGTYSRSGRIPAVVEAQLTAEKHALFLEHKLRVREYEVERSSLLDQRTTLTQELSNERDAETQQKQVLLKMQVELQTLISERHAGLTTNQQIQSQLFSVSQASIARAQLMQSEATTLGQKLLTDEKLNDGPATLATDLAKISSEIADLEEKIVENEAHDVINVVTPINGSINALTVRAGQSVRSGQQVAVVIPHSSKLVAEVYLDDTGAGYVSKGSSATLELAAFPARRYGTLHGHVTDVSKAPESQVGDAHNTTEESTTPAEKNEAGTPHARYRVWIAIDEQRIGSGTHEYHIPVGSHVTAHISVETRPLLRWLFDPANDTKQVLDDLSL